MKLKKLVKKIKPLDNYIKAIKHSIIPKPYSHSVKMNVNIKKGNRGGTALIPCTIYAMDHQIDLNPALIRKKDKQLLKYIHPNKKYKYVKDEELGKPWYVIEKNIVKYNPIHIKIELTDDEKEQGYAMCEGHGKVKQVEYSEFERCDKCEQKLVVAEVKQTRYRSCPSIKVVLGDKAKQDVVVPVEFGVNKSDITARYWFIPILIGGSILSTAVLLGWEIPPISLGFTIPNIGSTVTWILNIFLVGFIWLYFMPQYLYKTYKLFTWYNSVKAQMRRTKYPEKSL